MAGKSRPLPVHALVGAALTLAAATPASATVVRFTTNFTPDGADAPLHFDIQLFEAEAPAHAANFVNYVTSGRYDDQLIHRLIPGFVMQGGGFNLPSPAAEEQGAIAAVLDTDDNVPSGNPNGLSNTRGFVALAQSNFIDPDTGLSTGVSDPDSGTSQWFINYDDNSRLDTIDGGSFTVFGRVVNDTMAAVDELATLNTNGSGGETLGLETAGGQVVGQNFANLPFFNDGGGNRVLTVTTAEIVAPLAASDFNGDGTVDLDDFTALEVAFGGAGTAVSGDTNADGVVDLLDFDALAQQFGQTVGAAPALLPVLSPGVNRNQAVTIAAVPEPASLVAAALAAPLFRRRRPA